MHTLSGLTFSINLRFTTSWAISSTDQRARPGGVGLQTMAIMRWLCSASSSGFRPGWSVS
jgi:hypothetical protein